MPWKETCPMDEKLKFITDVFAMESFAAACRAAGISRRTGYKWVDRYEEEGLDGLKDRPSVAREPALKLEGLVEGEIVALRKARPTWGPKKLRAYLGETKPELRWPAASTFGDVLKRNGLIRPRRRRVHVPPGSSPLPPAEQPNEAWCIDFKGNFSLGDGSPCYPLTLTDHATRYLLKCEALRQPREQSVRAHLELAFREYGLPRRLRSDNGPPFATTAAGGLSALSIWWIKVGIVPERIQPAHPEQNGRHERMHRTLKAEAPPQDNAMEQQHCFDRFRRTYNEVRPHEALGQVPPARRYEPSRREYPNRVVSPEYEDATVRWTNRGRVRWHGRMVQVGPPVLHREAVGFRQAGESEWHVFFGPVVLGAIDERDEELALRPLPPREQVSDPAHPDTVSHCPECGSVRVSTASVYDHPVPGFSSQPAQMEANQPQTAASNSQESVT